MKVLCLLALGICIVNAGNLTERFAWRELEFSWPSDELEQAALKQGYIQGNNLPLAFDVWRDKIFLTVPRCYSNNSISLFMRIFKPINYTFPHPSNHGDAASTAVVGGEPG
jgi:hypothetical protein